MKIKKIRFFTKVTAFAMAVVLFLTLFRLPIGASGNEITEFSVSDREVSHYKTVKIVCKGKTLSGLLIANTTYIPLRSAGETVLGAKVSYNRASRTLTAVASGLSLSATDGSCVVEANGRYLYTQTPAVIMSNGSMYIPIRIFAKAVGLSVSWSGATMTATLSGSVRPIVNGNAFYRADEVFGSRGLSVPKRAESPCSVKLPSGTWFCRASFPRSTRIPFTA